jgi:hypothetical protein
VNTALVNRVNQRCAVPPIKLRRARCGRVLVPTSFAPETVEKASALRVCTIRARVRRNSLAANRQVEVGSADPPHLVDLDLRILDTAGEFASLLETADRRRESPPIELVDDVDDAVLETAGLQAQDDMVNSDERRRAIDALPARRRQRRRATSV